MVTNRRWRQRFTKLYYGSLWVLCPGLRNSQFAYRDALSELVMPGVHWLDLGCGRQLLPEWMPESLPAQARLIARSASVIGIDAFDDRPHVCGIPKIAGDIQRLPFADETFELVTANMVVEHIEDPRCLLKEVLRVLRPGGIFLFHTPNAKYFEVAIARCLPGKLVAAVASILDGRASEDIFPTHYRFNTRQVIEKLAEVCGLQIASIRHVECTAQAIMLGPFVILELLIIRALRLRMFEEYRSNLVVALRKPAMKNLRGSGDTSQSRSSTLDGRCHIK
jgi:ubiquinone/menaquinone biosynthesis C-methylase UbiE